MIGADVSRDLIGIELLLALVVALAVAIPAGVVGAVVLRAARLPHPALLVAVLGVLAAVALVGYTMTELTELATLAGAGIGALAGAVTSQYGSSSGSDRSPDDDDSV